MHALHCGDPARVKHVGIPPRLTDVQSVCGLSLTWDDGDLEVLLPCKYGGDFCV